MDNGKFLYNTPYDLAIRRRGFWPYVVLYGVVFLLVAVFALPAPFQLPLVAHHELTASASAWAFIGSYPLFHALMKPRILQTYEKLTSKFVCAALGIILLCFLGFFLQLTLPENPSTRTGRALSSSSFVAAIFLFAASLTASLALFMLIEPIRGRLARGL